jgi:hypothetical protein
MRAAPPVQMACGRGGRWRHAVGVLAATAALGLGFWAIGWLGRSPEALQVVLLLAVVSGVAVTWQLGSLADPGLLVWDGRSWSLQGQPGQVAVMIDLGTWLLLRFQGQGEPGSRWLPLDVRDCGAPAHLCRAALHAHAAHRQNHHA